MSDLNPDEQNPAEEENQPAAEIPQEEQPETPDVQSGQEHPQPAPPEAQLPPPAPRMLSDSEAHTWAMVAHLSILVNLFTLFLGPVIALIIYLIFRNRSRYVAFQSMQAFLFQLVFWIGGGLLIAVMWTVVGLLTAVLVGLCLIPIACVVSFIPIIALGYGIVGGINTAQGMDFNYWLIGDWTHELLDK
ncbi:MAG: DUF4870 domain-containing protein [Anaerolineales bacterium]|jgi:hypothetical protein